MKTPHIQIVLFSLCLSLMICPAKVRAQVNDGSSSDIGQTFHIMTWDLPEWSKDLFARTGSGVDSVAECDFTTAGFVRPQHLEACEKLGLKAIVAPQEFPINWREMPDQQITDTIKKMVDESRHSDAVVGYFLADEPSARDFAGLAKAVAAVKKLAPGKLPYINLLPDYATLGAADLSQLGTKTYEEYLQRFCNEVHPDILSYDNYRLQQSTDMRDPAIAASYYLNLLMIRRVAMEHGLPFWNIAGSTQIVKNSPPPSPASLQMQAYTTLAAGGRGMTWYTYFGSKYYLYAPVDLLGHRTETWSYLKMVNSQLKTLGPIMVKLKNTGVYFSSPAPVQGLPMLPGKLVEAITSAQPIMVGEFDGDGGEKYAMVVNLSLETSSNVKLTTHSKKIEQISAADGSLSPIEADNSLWLTAGQGALLKIQ